MNRLYFIVGAGGSGKTAIMPHLKNIFAGKIAVYDFDDIGVPENADKKWRQESTGKWLQKLLNEDKDVCLLGQMVLGEILACPSAKAMDKVNLCLLEADDFQRIQRLKKRNTYDAEPHMLHWASWLRMHHQDPQWAQHVIKEDCWHRLDFNTWDQLKSWEEIANIKIIDTTDKTIEHVAANVAQWVKEV